VSRIFWDTMLFIYWFEDHPQYSARVQEVLQKMAERSDRLCTSSLAVGETLAGFHKRGAIETANRVRDFFRHGSIEVIPYTFETAELYAEIRAKQRVSSADAIHLACAAGAGTDLFLTNDAAIMGRVIPGIQFIAGLDSRII
jgi:uncharacterized protein